MDFLINIKNCNQVTFFDFRILIEHFILDVVDIKSCLDFVFLSTIGSLAVKNPFVFIYGIL